MKEYLIRKIAKAKIMIGIKKVEKAIKKYVMPERERTHKAVDFLFELVDNSPDMARRLMKRHGTAIATTTRVIANYWNALMNAAIKLDAECNEVEKTEEFNAFTEEIELIGKSVFKNICDIYPEAKPKRAPKRGYRRAERVNPDDFDTDVQEEADELMHRHPKGERLG